MEITFTGDVSFTGSFSENINKSKQILAPEVVSYMMQSHCCVVNLEGPCTTFNSKRKDVNVVSPPASIAYLAKHGVSHFNIANNHILDCGEEGYLETKSLIDKVDGKIIGDVDGVNFNYDIVVRDNIRVALISMTQFYSNMGSKAIDLIAISHKAKLKALIKKIRADVDWIVLSYHGGEEYSIYPWNKRRKLLLDIISEGIDVIVCHHSHTVQPYEKIDENKYIFYSLGNFIFDLQNHRNKSYLNDSLILKFQFNKLDFNFDFMPLKIKPELGEVVMAGKGVKQFFELGYAGYDNKSWYHECERVVMERNKLPGKEKKRQNKFIAKCYKIKNILINDEFRAIVIGLLFNRLYKILK
jgi:poly-gamma-glutamate synthesis protein (capsule biosynthesis protein)